jgi:hypothetical protein
MNPIGKIAKEIGEEVAEKITKQPLKWGFKGRKPTDIKDLDYREIAKRRDMGYRFTKNDRLIKDEYDKLLKANKKEKNNIIKDILEFSNTRQDGPLPNYDLLEMANSRFKSYEELGIPRELTGKSVLQKLFSKNSNLVYNKNGKLSVNKKDKKTILRYLNDLDNKEKETFDILIDEWEGEPSELIDVVKSL